MGRTLSHNLKLMFAVQYLDKYLSLQLRDFSILVVGQQNKVDNNNICNDEPVDIASKIETLEDRFDDLRTRIINELSAKPGITVQVLLDKLTSLPVALKKEYESSIAMRLPNMRAEIKINELFINLNPLTSFIDYGLIEHFIRKFGSDTLKGDMRSYCSEMIMFMKETTIKQLIDHLPGQADTPPNFSLIEAKIGQNASECTLEQLNTIRKRYCSEVKLSEIIFHPVAVVESNSFIVRWLVPSTIVSDVIKSTKGIEQSFFQECKITSLTLDGMWLLLIEAEMNIMWSRMHVSDTKFKDQFHTMYRQIVYEVEMQGVSERKLSLSLNDWQPHHQSYVSIHSSRSFQIVDPRLSLVAFTMLTAVIKRFGSDCLKRVMKYYCDYVISIYTSLSTAQQLIALSPIPSKLSKYFTIAECRIMEKPLKFGIEKLLSFQTHFCTSVHINKICFVMSEVDTDLSRDSFIVRWLVPSALVSDIIKSTRNINQSFYQDFKITSLTLNRIWLFLSEGETDAMWSQVHVSDTKFKDQFHTMYEQIVFELEMQRISEHTLSSYFMSLQYQRNISDHLGRALLKHELPASFVDFKVLAAVIEKFGSESLKSVMRSYCKYISIFIKQSTAQQLINLSAKPSEDYSTAKCIIMEEPSQYTVDKLLSFRSRFCCIVDLSEAHFVMDEVNIEMSDSFTVSWLVPSSLISYIMMSTRNIDQSFYQGYKITSLTLDGMWVYISEAELEAMWLQVSNAKLVDRYRAIHKQIVLELKMENTPIDEISQCLMNHYPILQKDTSFILSRAIMKYPFPPSGSFIDFEMLSLIVKQFGSNCLKDVIVSYCNYMSVFIKQSTAQQLLDLLPIPSKVEEDFIKAECGIMKEPLEYTCDKILSIKNSISTETDSSRSVFTISHIRKPQNDSFAVSWIVPANIYSDLIESAHCINNAFYVRLSVASFSIGNQWMYNPKLIPFGYQLKEKYRQSQGSPSPVEWIPSPTKKVFRLVMIQKERVQQGDIEDKFVQMTVSGRVDDILHAKSPVELENIFKSTLHGGEIILIEGAPGSGKSTLTVHICQRWGKGKLFQQFTVVILVQLRDPAVQRAQTIVNLLPVKNAAVSQELAAELIATNGRGVLWVLDGWDELPSHLQEDSIFYKLTRRMLKECSVIVTSRPISSGDLHPVISSRIEVLGFTPEEQRQYFIECLKGDAKTLQALLEKIQKNPVVQSICYLPLNAAFIVHTFKYMGQSLPNTEYEIYLSVVLSCIQRHFEREGRDHDLPRELASLDDVSMSEAVREPFSVFVSLPIVV